MTTEDGRISWDEVQSAAAKMFHVWCGDGEIEWVKECWQHLGEAGLTGDMTAIETTAAMLRLVTLARVYEEFCGLAWDENPETPVDYLAEGLAIDPVALGILAANASAGDLADAGDTYELREAALLAATEAQRREIFECLTKAYGSDVQLYARMSKTNRSADEENEADEFEITGPNARALSFIMDGFQEG